MSLKKSFCFAPTFLYVFEPLASRLKLWHGVPEPPWRPWSRGPGSVLHHVRGWRGSSGDLVPNGSSVWVREQQTENQRSGSGVTEQSTLLTFQTGVKTSRGATEINTKCQHTFSVHFEHVNLSTVVCQQKPRLLLSYFSRIAPIRRNDHCHSLCCFYTAFSLVHRFEQCLLTITKVLCQTLKQNKLLSFSHISKLFFLFN